MVGAVELVGITAGLLAIFAFIPQIVKTYKLKSMKDLSSLLLLFMATSSSLWISYGILKSDYVIYSINSISISLIACLVSMKFVYDRKNAIKLFRPQVTDNLGLSDLGRISLN